MTESKIPFVDITLARRLELTEAHGNAAFIDAQAELDPDSGATRINVNGTMAMFSGVGSPLSQTFGLGMMAAPAPADLDRLEEFFKSRGSAVFHEVSPLGGVEAFTMLAERGYRPIELTSVMFRPIDADEHTAGLNPAIKVRQAALDEADHYGHLAARGWVEAPEVQPYILGFARISLRKATCMIAELDGAPIATGAVFVHENVALLAGASTVPGGRRKGAQLALLDARLRHSASLGCDLTMMCAAPGSPSQRNAERQGFRIAYTRVKWKL